MESVLLNVAGHRRSPATMPGYRRGRSPRNKGEQYPTDPPTVEEIVAVMRAIGDRADGHRLCAPIVPLWRAGLRISEALSPGERPRPLPRRSGRSTGKGGKRREVGMDRSAWEQLAPWFEIRRELPVGALLCVIHGPTAGQRWEASAARKQLLQGIDSSEIIKHRPRPAIADNLGQRRPPVEAIDRNAIESAGGSGPTRRHSPAWRKGGALRPEARDAKGAQGRSPPRSSRGEAASAKEGSRGVRVSAQYVEIQNGCSPRTASTRSRPESLSTAHSGGLGRVLA